MTTIPALDPVTDILDTDLVMVTNAQGNSYTIAGSELNKRNKIIMASNITVTGAPLKAGGSVRIYFSADITANDGNTVMQINYNGVNYYVKAPKDGGLINFVAHAVGNVYKYVQAYTTLEMLFDGNQFVIIGNPVVISNSDYVINADGSITYSANKINLFGRTIEQTTGGDTRIVLIGKTESADYSQGYTEIELIGGRVDGYLGLGYLFLAQNNLVVGKSVCIMSNLQVQVTQKDNQMYVYCTMDTYSNFIANISIRSKFNILNQIVSSVEGIPIWQNNWS